jgi:myosin heavy chain 9/10/11/14
LQLAEERAERERQAKEALETLKMTLEADKRRVEDELQAERNLGVDKDALLERSKRREAELEEEISAMQTDLEVLDSQLEKALERSKASEEKRESMREAFEQAAEHLVRLEMEQKEWEARENELLDQIAEADKEIELLRSGSSELQKVGEELKNLALQREEDVARTKERADVMLQEMEGKLRSETQSR